MIKEVLKDKKILFFSVQTFSLEKEIIKKLEEFGAIVEYFDERPANNNFTKAIIRLRRKIYQLIINKYYNNILKITKNEKYDYLFVNKGEVIPRFFLKEFREQHPQTEFVFYTWDSFENNRHALTILEYFDKKYTFDSSDAIKYKIGFRPLFFLDQYQTIKHNLNLSVEYDLLFLGTAHSDRYRISNFFVNWCNGKGFKVYCYYYMQGKIVYFYKRLFDKSFKEFDYRKLSFSSLTSKEILDLYSKSNVILDINHPSQVGLTMRTFEAIGASKKIITTNREIGKYPFYNSNNILIVDRNDIVISEGFFSRQYQEIGEDLYEKCSMKGWLECLFVKDQKEYWSKVIE